MSKLQEQLKEEREDIKARAHGVKIVDRELFRDRVQINRFNFLIDMLLWAIICILLVVIYSQFKVMGLL